MLRTRHRACGFASWSQGSWTSLGTTLRSSTCASAGLFQSTSQPTYHGWVCVCTVCHSDDLFDALRAALIARLSDKVPSVRVEGIKAVHRLQDPTNADDEVVQGFLRLMSTDSSA